MDTRLGVCDEDRHRGCYVYWQEQVLGPAGEALCFGILTSSTSETQLLDCLGALTRQVSHRGQNFEASGKGSVP